MSRAAGKGRIRSFRRCQKQKVVSKPVLSRAAGAGRNSDTNDDVVRRKRVKDSGIKTVCGLVGW